MKVALIVAPVAASYLPTVSPLLPKPVLDTNRWPFLSIASPTGWSRPCPLTRAALIVAPVMALYSPIVLLPTFDTYRSGWAAAWWCAKTHEQTAAAARKTRELRRYRYI